MNGVGIFNANNTKTPTNEDIIVVFSPYTNIQNYIYQIFKNNIKIKEELVKTSEKKQIVLKETGNYQIIVKSILETGQTIETKSNVYTVDKEAPHIRTKKEKIEINSIKDINENIVVKDNYDPNVKITTNFDKLNQNYKGTQKLLYTVIDNAGNINQKSVDVVFKNTPVYTHTIYGIMIILTTILIYFLLKLRKAEKIRKRIEPFTVKPLKDKSQSISEILIITYQALTRKLNKELNKSQLATKYAKKLDKYIPVTNIHKTGMDILSGKILVGLLFSLITVLLESISFRVVGLSELILVFTVSFFSLDILYFIKYKVFRWKIENDFVHAISIMNNAFKSGRSITQAIDTVSTELKGVVGKEFNRMSLELLYGLELEVVFKRFAKRIELEEANYLTASLTILNKTGGDIIKVFDSIERNMYDKRKLRLELASLTSGSKIVVYTLLGMPFLFALVISIINPEYFMPFINTQIGNLLLIFMIIYYIIFVVVVRKIMKVVI